MLQLLVLAGLVKEGEVRGVAKWQHNEIFEMETFDLPL